MFVELRLAEFYMVPKPTFIEEKQFDEDGFHVVFLSRLAFIRHCFNRQHMIYTKLLPLDETSPKVFSFSSNNISRSVSVLKVWLVSIYNT